MFKSLRIELRMYTKLQCLKPPDKLLYLLNITEIKIGRKCSTLL